MATKFWKFDIYRYHDSLGLSEKYDTTNGGISAKGDKLTVFAAELKRDEVEAICKEKGLDVNRVARVNKRMLWGEKHYTIEPVVKPRGVVGPMMGGNFAYSCDARWVELTECHHPLPIHDRFETQEVYDGLSI